MSDPRCLANRNKTGPTIVDRYFLDYNLSELTRTHLMSQIDQPSNTASDPPQDGQEKRACSLSVEALEKIKLRLCAIQPLDPSADDAEEVQAPVP